MYQQWYFNDQEPNSALVACQAMGADSCLFFCWDEEDALVFVYNEFDEQKLIEATAELTADIEIEMRYQSKDESLEKDPDISQLLEKCPNGCAGVFWYEGEMLIFSFNVDEEKADQVSQTLTRIIEPSDQTVH